MHDLDPGQWRQVGALFDELVALDPAERSARLSTMSNDTAIRSALESLLEGDALADERLPKPGFGALHAWSAADPLQLVGRTISHFRVDELVASGGMGVVYRAEDLQLQRAVALKFLLPDGQLTASSKERFIGEARAAGALDHPNLCPVYEIGESSAGLFLAMPLYKGETLKDLLNKSRTVPVIPVDDALAIVSQIAVGLQCAHAAGIAHRDIKPGNIMILPDASAKILDFGLARDPTEPTRAMLGTVNYMSPEQVRGDPVDTRTDLWALGVILYEMLAGARPFSGATTADILRGIEHAEPRSLFELMPGVMPDVEALVRSLLQKNPNDRCPDANQIIDAITAIRSASRPRGRWSRALPRRRRLAMVGGVGIVALIAIATAMLGTGRTLIERGVIGQRDPLVVADFEVGGSDTALGPLLANSLGRYLGGSSGLTILSRGRVESALLRMRRPAGSRLTPMLAREVAQREGARAFVRGDLVPLGAGYIMTIRLVAAATGVELAEFHSTAARSDIDLLPALDKLGGALRRAIGESLRDVPEAPPMRKYTTSSLEALRLFDKPSLQTETPEDRLLRVRAVVTLDSTFAYAWLVIGNTYLGLPYRTAAQDSAFTMMYRFRDQLTPFERAQATAFYWRSLGLERARAVDAYYAEVLRDSLDWRAVLNLAGTLIDMRQPGRAERLLTRYKNTVGARALTNLIQIKIQQGRPDAADSILASNMHEDPQMRILQRTRMDVALAELKLDTAENIAGRAYGAADASLDRAMEIRTLVGIARARGRLSEAHRLSASSDSIDAGLLAVAKFDPVIGHQVALAGEELWLMGEPRRAKARLDDLFAAHDVKSLKQVQDRMDAVQAAAIYAAAGRPGRSRSIVDAIVETSDSLGLRAIFALRKTAMGEIALAENRPTDAMKLFHESDLAVDGLPASRCSVCVLPRLARAAEKAGLADSARVYWERFVTTPSLDRLQSDQWFLMIAYRRLSALHADTGNCAKASAYDAMLSNLWKNADARLKDRPASSPSRQTAHQESRAPPSPDRPSDCGRSLAQ